MSARRLATIATAVTVAAAGLVAVAPAQTGSGSHITPRGVGDVTLGSTYTSLHKKKLIGKISFGCELNGPNTRAAPLRSPLKGGVDLTLTLPRKVSKISVTGGSATARGVGIGATTAEIKAAFPTAKVDHSTDRMFLLTLVRIPRGGGGRIVFGVDTRTKKVAIIGIPAIPFCE